MVLIILKFFLKRHKKAPHKCDHHLRNCLSILLSDIISSRDTKLRYMHSIWLIFLIIIKKKDICQTFFQFFCFPLIKKSNEVCKYFANGYCRNKPCSFKHEVFNLKKLLFYVFLFFHFLVNF